MMHKALVTGGAGFVGYHLCRALLAKGCAVTILDDLSTGFRENIPQGAKLLVGDIRNPADVAQAMDGCDTVFHLAARVELRKTIVDPADCYSVNIMGTAQVLMECLKEPDRRLVFASSCAVYPLHPEAPLREEDAGSGQSPYALSKLAGEQTLDIYAHLKGLSACSLRCFNIYGPRQRADSPYSAVIPRFISMALDNAPLTVYGEGTQTRDFISIDDVITAYLLAAQSQATGAYNIATGRGRSINELAETVLSIGKAKGYTPSVKHLEAAAGDASASVASIERAQNALGFAPVVQLEEGLEGLFTWWQKASC